MPHKIGYSEHVSEHFRNPEILIHFLWGWVYGSRGAFAVVSVNQCLSIDGEKQRLDFFTNVAYVHLILKWCLSGLSFSEVSCRAGTSQLICGESDLTGFFMVQGFAEGCFRTDFSCLTFYQYLSLSLVWSYVAGLPKSSNLFFLSTLDADVFCSVQE